MRRLQVVALVLALPVLADDRLTATHTDRFNVPAAGTIRIENSFGEVDIDGWDRREIEVTVIRLSEHFSNEKGRAEAQRRLDSVQITTKQDGNDVIISTSYPPRNGLMHLLSRRSDIEISYRIKAPRASKLVIAHNSGGVGVYDISGDIHATAGNGQITLTLPAEGQYAIDARCKIGAVYSDFEGRDQKTAPAANVYLRVRFGDIVILKLHGPPTG